MCIRDSVCTQTVIVARGGNRDAQQILILVNRLDDRGQKQQELTVFRRGDVYKRQPQDSAERETSLLIPVKDRNQTK